MRELHVFKKKGMKYLNDFYIMHLLLVKEIKAS